MLASRNQEVVELLTNCMDLPGITPVEMSLLREMIHAWGMGLQGVWGAGNLGRAEEVAALFFKCQELLNVSYA